MRSPRVRNLIAACVLALAASACSDTDLDTSADDEPSADTGDEATTETDAGPATGTDEEAGSEAGTASTVAGDATAGTDPTATTGAAAQTDTTLSSTPAELLTDTFAGQGIDTILGLVDLVGITEITDGEITIFAPSDEAFASVQADQIAALVNDPTLIFETLSSHVAEGSLPSSTFTDGQTISVVSGEELLVGVDGDTITIGRATVINPDLEFEGGTIHIIDDVLRLPEL